MISDDDTTLASRAGIVAGAAGSDARLEHFTVRELLGRGGMGEVRLAHDQRLDREVAIKRLRPELAASDLVARFLREAKIQARLDYC
jgi:serine/threonine protein kinase